jgi:hypothetical protein
VKAAPVKPAAKPAPVTKPAAKPAAKETAKPGAKVAPAKPAPASKPAPAKPEKKAEPAKPTAKLPEVKNAPAPRPAPKPQVYTKPEPKPVANPIYVPPGPDGKPGIKFAPIAVIERPTEKERTSKETPEDMKTSPRFAFMEGEDTKKGVTVEDKLRALYDIQLIDSRIDKIRAMRGELPLEVEDLEDEVAGLQTRITRLEEEMAGVDGEINNRKRAIKDSEALIKKYKEQLNNVKNNREFESLNKEIEFQELEIELNKKRIRESEAQKATKDELLQGANGKLTERQNDLKVKQAELDEIINETRKEEEILRAKSDDSKKLIDARLLDAYERIRGGAPNGLAVVPIEREASAGSFIQIPPQKQMDVAARKKVIVDEHSGRILVDGDLAREEAEKIEALLQKEMNK